MMIMEKTADLRDKQCKECIDDNIKQKNLICDTRILVLNKVEEATDSLNKQIKETIFKINYNAGKLVEFEARIAGNAKLIQEIRDIVALNTKRCMIIQEQKLDSIKFETEI